MTFRLPKITYPLSVDTIGQMLALGYEMSVHCRNGLCNSMDEVNLVQLGKRIGMDHSVMRDDLWPYFSCSRCKAAGRPHKNVGFILRSNNPCSELPAERYPWVG